MTRNEARAALLDKTVTVHGDTWTIVGVGNVDENGRVYLHLSSQTRFRAQKNGKNPVQSCDWFALDDLKPPRYCATAVDAAIASSCRAGRKIGGRERKMIHALLRGRD